MLEHLTIFLIILSLNVALRAPLNNAARQIDSDTFGNLPKLEEGDLIFRKGSSIESYAVLLAQNNTVQRYSHVGLIHFNKDNIPMVIHAAPSSNSEKNTVQQEPIETFWAYKNATAGLICRLELNCAQKKIIHNHLTSIINRNAKFDGNYDLRDTVKLYCTELLYHTFKKVSVDITGGHIDTLTLLKKIPIILPATILNYNELKTVHLYH